MATVESWGGTIADIGPVYPMVGTEGVLVIIGVAFWIVWHVIQGKRENREYEEQIRKYGGRESSNGSSPKRILRTRSHGVDGFRSPFRRRGRLEKGLYVKDRMWYPHAPGRVRPDSAGGMRRRSSSASRPARRSGSGTREVDATDPLPTPSTGAPGSPATASIQEDAALINERRARSRCARIALAPRSASRLRTASNTSRCCTL